MRWRRWSFFRRVNFDLITASASAVRSGVRRLLEGLGLRESVIVRPIRRVVETISLSEVIQAIRQQVAQISETIALNEFIRINSFLRRLATEVLSFAEDVVIQFIQAGQVLITEVISLAESIVTRFTITRVVSEAISFAENVVTRLLQLVTRTVSESLTISEIVSATTQQSQPSRPWDYFLAYDHNNQQIQVSDTALYDNNTSTYVTFFYTPPVPQNLRRAILGFNTPRYYFMISFYLTVNTLGKYLIVKVYDSFGNSETYTINPTQGSGWYDVYIDYYNISNVKEVEIMTDSSILGSLSVAEVVFSQQ